MSKTTADLIPANLITRIRNLERRVTVLEKLVRRDATDLLDLILLESATGHLYRLECEYVNGEISLFLSPVAESNSGVGE